jgi:hypothetical protein
MKMTIGFSQFCGAFNDTYKNSFSYNGKRALYDYLEEYEESTGEQVELDTVALCCDYSEHESAHACALEYTVDKTLGVSQDDTAEDTEKIAREWLEDRTTVIDVTGGGVIIQNL